MILPFPSAVSQDVPSTPGWSVFERVGFVSQSEPGKLCCNINLPLKTPEKQPASRELPLLGMWNWDTAAQPCCWNRAVPASAKQVISIFIQLNEMQIKTPLEENRIQANV